MVSTLNVGCSLRTRIISAQKCDEEIGIETMKTYGDVRAAIERHDLGWRVNPEIPDHRALRKRLLGGPPIGQRPADGSRVDVPALVRERPAPHMMGSAGGAGGTRPTAVDWRTWNGWNIFTRTRDQFDSEHCWIFAPTGVIEAMTRIEHCTWAPRSEGDIVRGLGVVVGQCGDAVNSFNWVQENGQADPGCIPWPFPADRSGGYWNPAPGNCGTGSTEHTTVTPSADRAGRTVKIPAYTSLNHIEDMKNWIWLVGPAVASSIVIYDDFYGYSDISTVYRPAPNQHADGTHVVDVVGFDDAKQAWLIRNSWGGTPGADDWGTGGFGWIGYGVIGIDTNPMYGIRGTDPDPWCKRSNHNGGMVESGDGANHDNFELFVPAPGNVMAHWWRDNGSAAMPWAQTAGFAADVATAPSATGTTFNRNFEVIYGSVSHRLRHWWFNQTSGTWNDGATFGPPDGVGTPGFVQGSYGDNFEVVTARANGQLQHYWRTGNTWNVGPVFGSGVREAGGSLIQTSRGNLELVCLLESGQLQHWTRADGTTWAWSSGATFAANCSYAPVLIEGQFGRGDEFASGNYELVVALTTGQLQHWWRGADGVWRTSATFGTDVYRVLSILQSSFGFNLEVIVQLRDNRTQHFWRDGGGWHAGVVIGPAL